MPQTRSKGAPASRVYSSSPAPQQVHFPQRKTTARTYGKKGPKRDLRQQTITQIDFLEPMAPEELDELEEAEEREFERRRKRRRTEGDGAVRAEEAVAERGGKGKGRRKTEGDGLGSSFHTQTLTQLYGDGTIRDSEDEDEDEVAVGGGEGVQAKSPSVIPQTPLKRKTRIEIPSSQPSPCSPMLLRYSPLGPRASPLKSRSTNVGSPLPGSGSMRKKTPRGLVIQDSFASGVSMESGVSQASVSGVKGGDSSQRVTSSQGEAARDGSGGGSAKRVFQRVEIPDSDAEDSDGHFDFTVSGDMTSLTVPDTPTKRLGPGSQSARKTSGPSPGKRPGNQGDRTPAKQLGSGSRETQKVSGSSPEKGLQDQGDGGEGIPDTPTKLVDSGTPAAQRPSGASPPKAANDQADSFEGDPGTEDLDDSYPIGANTQFALDFLASTEENALRLSGAPQSSHPAPHGTNPSSVPSSRPAHKSPTPQTTPQRPQKKQTLVHFSSPHISFEDEVRSSDQHKTQAYTQMGSQRVDFDIIRAMPAATGRTDIFISVHPEHARRIADGTKDHEFRGWKMPVTVCRAWIYVTKPESRLRYMACVGPAKGRREIREGGLGNAEFNRGKGNARFAHEILELYELNNPVSMNRMRENGWWEAPPQRYSFVPPVVVSQLQANLRCRVLPRDAEEENEFGDELQDSQPRDSQGVEEQLLSDIAYSTQRPVEASSGGLSHDCPSFAPRSPRDEHGGRNAQAEQEKSDEQVVPSSQATTASDESVPRPANPSSSIPVFHDSGSPVRVPEGDWGVDTSQLVGVSQLLPDSLLRDCGPPEDFDI